MRLKHCGLKLRLSQVKPALFSNNAGLFVLRIELLALRIELFIIRERLSPLRFEF